MGTDPNVLDQWTLERHLGTGGSGSVWLGRNREGTVAAVKVLHPHATDTLTSPERFERELEIARRVTSRRVAIPIDADLDGDRPYIAWEFIDGPTLADRVATSGPLSGDELLQLARDLAEALRDLHGAEITHRDVKPANVIISADGAVLVDLGIAVLEGQTSMTTQGSLLGTPGWMTPEQLDGTPPTVASDVFNWGCVVAFAATGHAPFGGDTLPKMMYSVAHEPPDLEGVPDLLRPLLDDALSKTPNNRPAARDLARYVHDMLAGNPSVPSPPAPPAASAGTAATVRLGHGTRQMPSSPEAPTQVTDRSDQRSRRGRWAAASVALVAVAAVAVGIYYLTQDESPTTTAVADPTVDPSSPTPTVDPSSPTPTTTELDAETTSPDDPTDGVDPDDPAAYYTNDGSPPALIPGCAGLMSLCLGNPIDLAVERLGTEDQRYPGADGGTARAWDLGDVTLTLDADDIGTIQALAVGARERARVGTPIENIVVGDSTVQDFVDTVGGPVQTDVLSGEGFTTVTWWIHAGGEGAQYRSVDVWVDWSDPTSEEVFGVDPGDAATLTSLLGDQVITSFEVGHGTPFGEAAPQPDPVSDQGDHGQPPAWVEETLADLENDWALVDGSVWTPGAPINAVTGNRAGSATGRGMRVFFFAESQGYIGTDASDASEIVTFSWRNDTTIAVEYTLYPAATRGAARRAGPPLSASSGTVRSSPPSTRFPPLTPREKRSTGELRTTSSSDERESAIQRLRGLVRVEWFAGVGYRSSAYPQSEERAMPSKNWDRVQREDKYQRGIRAHERFLESLLPDDPDDARRGGGSVAGQSRGSGSPPAGERRPDAQSISRHLRPVVTETWGEFEVALKSELARMAQDRVLVVGAKAPEEVATSGYAHGLYVAFPVSRTRLEAESARARGFDLGMFPRLAGKWWWWPAGETGVDGAAAQLRWLCSELWNVDAPSRLGYEALLLPPH